MDDPNRFPKQKDKNNSEIHKDDNKQEPNAKIHPSISPVAVAFIGLIGGFFLYQIVGGLLILAIFGLDVEHAPVNSVRLMTMAGQLLFILLPALLFSKWFYSDVTYVIRAKLPSWKEIGIFVIGIIVITPLLQNYLYIQNYLINISAQRFPLVQSIKHAMDSLDKLVENEYMNLLTAHSFFEAVLIVVVVAVIPALCEETMFRGFIQRSFEFKMNPFWAALITAVFFGVYHFSPYGLIPLIGLGFYFGFSAYMSNSILVPMVLHFLNNFFAITMFFIYGNDELLNSNVDKNIDLVQSSVTFLILLVVFFSVIYFIKRYYKQKLSSVNT
jgi:CAAX protease family protein